MASKFAGRDTLMLRTYFRTFFLFLSWSLKEFADFSGTTAEDPQVPVWMFSDSENMFTKHYVVQERDSQRFGADSEKLTFMGRSMKAKLHTKM